MCYDRFLYCINCSESACTGCAPHTKQVDDHCEVDPNMEQIGSCKIQIHEINDDINTLDLGHYALQYTPNFPNFNVIDHYVNKDYTLTESRIF